MASSTLKIESLFIDEGFGSLDPESLQLAMDALDGLQAQGRKVGVISHVQEMHERIPVQMGTTMSEGTPFKGGLQLIDNQVDVRSGTVRVRAKFDNADGSLMPGQFARIRMGHAEPQRALMVSERAVGTDQDKKFVMVVGTDNKVSYREITLGEMADGLRVVTSGLKEGERIVVKGLQRVRPGALVAPEQVSMDGSAIAAAQAGQ